MNDITERLRSLYVQYGTDYVQEAADEIERLRAELNAIAAALPGARYMDPPDGGDVSIAEQVQRMRAELDALKSQKTVWEPIETAPKDGSSILLATPTGKIADGMWSLQYGVWAWPYVMVNPVYWKPLLAVPRPGEGND